MAHRTWGSEASPSKAARHWPRALRVLLSLAAALLIGLPALAHAREIPALQAHVNDTAGMLSTEERAQLEQKLSEYEHKTGRQFALLTIDSLNGDALEDFSIRVVEAWKLGQKGKDSGLLLLVVKNEHKLRVEVGYGLEGTVTDAFSSRVIRNVLTPALRAGKVEAGLEQAFDLLMRQAAGEDVPGSAVPDPEAPPAGGGPSPLGWIALLFILGPFLIPLLLFSARRRGGGGFGGGGFGGGGFGGGGFGGGGGGFSGGGGGFGGGGASGSW